MGITASKRPLATTTQANSLPFVLYDTDEVLEIRPEVAQGYLILLTGGAAGLRKKTQSTSEFDISDDALTVSFVALTDGNVIDACFGVPHSHPADRASAAYKASRVVKLKISEATDTSDAIRRVAVQAYANAFRVVLDYHEARSRYPVCLRCFKEGSLRQNAENSLEHGFESLTEALGAST